MFRLFRARLAGGIAVGVTIWHNGPAIPVGGVRNSISSSPELAATEWRIERLGSSRTIWGVSAASTARRFFRCAFRAISAGDECNSQRRGGGRASRWVGGMGLGGVLGITVAR